MRSTAGQLIENIRTAFRTHGVRNAGLVVAFSGGADSSALLSGVMALRTELSLVVRAAYFDHGLQPAEDRDGEYRTVEATAERLGVPLVTGGVRPGTIEAEARERGCGIEASARLRRYSFLEEVARECGAAYLCTGHHREDLIETVILRVLQGAGVAGLAGIPETRELDSGILVIRPLLATSKRNILDHLANTGLSWREDPSNACQDYSRNLVRHRILPTILNAFPNSAAAVPRFARRNAEIAGFIRRAAARSIRWERTNDGFHVSADAFWEADSVLRIESVLGLMNRTGDEERIPARMLDVLRRKPESGGVIFRARGCLLYQLGGGLFFRTDIARQNESGYLFMVRPAPIGWSEVEIKLPFAVEVGSTVRVPLGVIHGALIVRSWRAGDRIRLSGGSKTLKRLLPELGVPFYARYQVPILEDTGGLLAVCADLLGGTTRFAERLVSYAKAADDAVEIRFGSAIG